MRKVKSYSISDEVIDEIIRDIIYGDLVEDACYAAGITVPTLYRRLRARGYNDVRGFFRMKRKELKRADLVMENNLKKGDE